MGRIRRFGGGCIDVDDLLGLETTNILYAPGLCLNPLSPMTSTTDCKSYRFPNSAVTNYYEILTYPGNILLTGP